MAETATALTPWQKIYKRFGVDNQSEFARLLGVDRSKVSRVLADKEGLVSGRDLKRIIKAAETRGVPLAPDDLIPVS